MIEFMNIAEALSDGNRVRIVMAPDSRENDLDWVIESISNNPTIKKDAEKLDELLSFDADGKCR